MQIHNQIQMTQAIPQEQLQMGQQMLETQEQQRELTLNDRCDSCGAAAKVVATLLNGELLFCGHHARKLGTSLVIKSVNVYDPEGVLNLIQ